jgi:hypothetical protein
VSFIKRIVRGGSGRERPVKSMDDLINRVNDIISDGIGLNTGLSGEILELSFAPNEQKIVSHGLGIVPKYRLILRQEGNGLITDVSSQWNKNSVAFLNNSAVDVRVTIKLFGE